MVCLYRLTELFSVFIKTMMIKTTVMMMMMTLMMMMILYMS